MPLFSVVIATRDRPEQFRQAVASVLAQSLQDIEVIVVNDGSGEEHQQAYAAILAELDPKCIRSFNLHPRPNGHGASYARNHGAAQARAPYICFLDDDDSWTDHGHLSRAHLILSDSTAPVDLYLSNQIAFLNGVQRPGVHWLGDLAPTLAQTGLKPDRHGAYAVKVDDLLKSNGFCHLNTLIVRRALYQEIGGFDERIGWEEDRDLYLRLIDRSTIIRYVPARIARHNIPDPTKRASVTTSHSDLERRLSQLRVLDRAIFTGRHPGIRAYGRRFKTYTLKAIAESLAAAGRHREAAFYAREALGAGPTIKWAGYTFWRTLRALASQADPVVGISGTGENIQR